ncbi:MAG: hypothetical protein RSE33_19585 [Hafnia sp.]
MTHKIKDEGVTVSHELLSGRWSTKLRRVAMLIAITLMPSLGYAELHLGGESASQEGLSSFTAAPDPTALREGGQDATPPDTVVTSQARDLAALSERVKQLEERTLPPSDDFPVLQTEQDAYSVGLMVAQYAKRIMSDMNMVGIALDTAVVEKGIKDGMADRARLPLATTQAVIAQLETQMANGIALKERDTLKILNDIARTQNTLAKSQGLVWVGKQKGQSTAQPAKVTIEGKRYLGAQFEAPRTVLLNDKEAMNATIKKSRLVNRR